MNASEPLILNAVSEDHVNHIRTLFAEYSKSLKVDLCFQNFDSELRNLPGEYAEPRGSLFLALVNNAPAGCCALKPFDTSDYANACEMKRLYVHPEHRRLGIGRGLTESTLDAARLKGYSSVLLDTLDEMESARALYAEIGFFEIPPYYYNPIPGAHYLRVEL
jgi:ribosomal protein S18 acetylase RimI-like enzyme